MAEVVAGAIAASVVLCAADKGSAIHKRRKAEQSLRDRDATLCELLAPRMEVLSDFCNNSPLLALQRDLQVPVLMVHCGQMVCCDSTRALNASRSWLASGAPVQVQAKLGAKGFSVMRESPGVELAPWATSGDRSFVPEAMAEPVAVAPFDWTCAFLLDRALPLANVLRLRVRKPAAGSSDLRSRLSSRELGRVDLVFDLKEETATCHAPIRDAMGRRVGIIDVGYEIRKIRLADLCTHGLNLGLVVDAPGLAEVAGGQDGVLPLMKGVPTSEVDA
jgi:hypothetical protein